MDHYNVIYTTYFIAIPQIQSKLVEDFWERNLKYLMIKLMTVIKKSQYAIERLV